MIEKFVMTEDEKKVWEVEIEKCFSNSVELLDIYDIEKSTYHLVYKLHQYLCAIFNSKNLFLEFELEIPSKFIECEKEYGWAVDILRYIFTIESDDTWYIGEGWNWAFWLTAKKDNTINLSNISNDEMRLEAIKLLAQIFVLIVEEATERGILYPLSVSDADNPEEGGGIVINIEEKGYLL